MGRYSDEFKAKAKALALRSEDSYETTAKKLGVNSSTLRNWMIEEPPVFLDKNTEAINTNRKVSQLEVDIHQLKIDLVKRDKEISFLKKVAAYFAQNQRLGF